MLYVPTYTNGNCAYLYSDNFIRVYDSQPSYNSNIHYIDYLINNHYISREGVQQFGNYSTLPSCASDITTNYFYRTDIMDILVVCSIFIFINYFFISKLYKALFRGRALK